MSTLRTAVALGAAASVLAVPTVASAHPSVYETTAKVATTPPTYTDQQRYVVANHGFTFVLRETNGLGAGSRGVVSYAKAAGRTGDAILDSSASQTGVQAHATCHVASLETNAVIRSWQNDPFYDYVPFQTDAAGLEDDPQRWLPVVKQATGVDLTRIPDTDAARKAACEAPAVGGVYYPADETQSSNATFNSGLIAETRAPYESRIASLQQDLVAAQAARDAAAEDAAAQKARADQAAAPARPLAVRADRSPVTAKAIAADGVPTTVTGPAGQAVRVRATLSPAQARRHGLRSTVLGSTSGTVGRDGSVRIVVRPSKSQGARLLAAKGGVPVTLELVAGSAKTTVAR